MDLLNLGLEIRDGRESRDSSSGGFPACLEGTDAISTGPCDKEWWVALKFTVATVSSQQENWDLSPTMAKN